MSLPVALLFLVLSSGSLCTTKRERNTKGTRQAIGSTRNGLSTSQRHVSRLLCFSLCFLCYVPPSVGQSSSESVNDIVKAANVDMDAKRWADAAAKYEQVRTYFEKEAADHPDDLSARSDLKRLYLSLAEAQHWLKDEIKSRDYLEKASSIDPNDTTIRRELALSYFENKLYAEAATRFEELARMLPNESEYRYLLGKALMEMKAYPRAIAVLQQLLQMRPDYVEAYSTLGSIYYVQEDWPRAAQMLLRFVEMKPRQAFSHFVLATCFDRMGNAKEAAFHYNKFLEFDDGSNDARSFQARQRAKTLERRLKK